MEGVPGFAWITPNLCDDMHGTTGCPSNEILTGDTWLSQWVPLITGTPVYQAPSVVPGTVDSTQRNHYSLLKTSEDLLAVPELGQAKSATSLASGFNL